MTRKAGPIARTWDDDTQARALAMRADGMSNEGIAARLGFGKSAVVKHIGPSGRGRGTGFWNDDRDAVLGRMVASGESYSDIAKTLGEGVTRAMVSGRAARLGMKSPKAAERDQITSGLQSRINARSMRVKAKRGNGEVYTFTAPTAPRPARTIPLQCEPKPLMDLGAGCRWPINDGEDPEHGFLFCAAPRACGEGSPYCAGHRDLARGKVEPFARPHPAMNAPHTNGRGAGGMIRERSFG